MEKAAGGKMKLILIAISTQESITTIKNMVKVSLSGKVGTDILAAISLTNDMDMEKCIGTMEQYIKVTGSKESNMDSVR